MIVSAVTEKQTFHNLNVYETGVSIDEKLAEAYVGAKYAVVIEEQVEVKEEAPEKPKKTTKKKKVVED